MTPNPNPLPLQGSTWKLAAAASVFSLFACGPEPEPAVVVPPQRAEFEAPKNVVLYMVDTLRSDHLGCYGYERDTSPRIDAFAEEALLFENCIAQSTWTKPASASVLTGLYPSLHGMLSESAVLPLNVKNIAGQLADSGMATGAFAGNQYVFRGQGEMLREFDYKKGFSSKEPPSYARAEVIVDAALEWIEARGDQPFFAYVHTVDPHAPYGGTPPYDAKFIDPEASDVDGYYVLKNSSDTLAKISEADRQRLIDLYDGDVAYTDHEFGRFLDRLEELGHYEDTMIIFVSDHGEEFNEHGSWQHNPFMHPEVLNVPLIVRMPKGAQGALSGRRSDLCGQVDVVPTILDALGMWPRKGLSGRTLLIDPGSVKTPPIFSEIEGGASLKALVSQDYKYVRRWSPATGESLYDLNKDPGEFEDIAKDEPELVAMHRKQMDAFLATAASGYSMLFQNETDEWMTVDCSFMSTEPFDRVKLIFADTKARHGDKRDGPPEFSRQGGFYLAKVRLHVKPRDGDGISFVLGEGAERVDLDLLIDGQPAQTSRVRMGPKETRPDKFPIELMLEDAAELSAPQPQARGRFQDDPYRILVWTNMRAETEEVAITAEERADLEALGYGGEDEDEDE